MQRKHLLNAVLVGMLVFSGCAEYPRHEQEGMVIGGVLGGVLGSQVGSGDGRTAAIIVGTIAGSMIGGAVVGGNREKVYGTACRQPDGSWQVQG